MAIEHIDPNQALHWLRQLIECMGDDDAYGPRWRQIAEHVVADCEDYLEEADQRAALTRREIWDF